MTRTSLARAEPGDSGQTAASPAEVVVLGPVAPGWLHEWCRRTGRRLDPHSEVRVHPAGPSPADAPPDDALTGRTVWIAHAPPGAHPRRIVAALRRLPEDDP